MEMLKLVFTNWNNWYLIALAMPLAMLVVRISRMKIRSVTYHDDYTDFSIKAPSARYRHARIDRGVFSYSRTLSVSMATCTVIMAVFMVIESHRGITQAIMDLGRVIPTWLSATVTIAAIVVYLSPLLIEQWLQLRYCHQHGISYTEFCAEDYEDEDDYPVFEANPVVLAVSAAVFLIALGLLVYDEASWLSMLAAVLLGSAAYYKLMEVWYWFCQYLVSVFMALCRLGANLIVGLVRLFAYVCEFVWWLGDKITAPRRERELKRAIQNIATSEEERKHRELVEVLDPGEVEVYSPEQWRELQDLLGRSSMYHQ